MLHAAGKRHKIRESAGDRIFNLVVSFIGIVIMLIVLVPLIFVVSASFSDPELVLRGKVLLIPKGVTLKAYTMVFENAEIWRYDPDIPACQELGYVRYHLGSTDTECHIHL